jgi:hypothetical protein
MYKSFVVMALMPLIFAATATPHLVQTSDDSVTTSEAREAREVATKFLAEIQRTRDLEPFDRDVLKDQNDMRQLLINSIAAQHVRQGVLNQGSPEDLQRFFSVMISFSYLSMLYFFSHFPASLAKLDRSTIDQQLPPDVRVTVLNDPILRGWWIPSEQGAVNVSNIEQLKRVSDSLDKVNAMMREYFRKNPPEATSSYSQNLDAIQGWLMQPSVLIETFGERRIRYIQIEVPGLMLLLEKHEGRLKIAFVMPYLD